MICKVICTKLYEQQRIEECAGKRVLLHLEQELVGHYESHSSAKDSNIESQSPQSSNCCTDVSTYNLLYCWPADVKTQGDGGRTG